MINPDIIDAHYLTSYGIFASRLNFHPFIINCWGSDVLIDPKIFGAEHIKKMKEAVFHYYQLNKKNKRERLKYSQAIRKRANQTFSVEKVAKQLEVLAN